VSSIAANKDDCIAILIDLSYQAASTLGSCVICNAPRWSSDRRFYHTTRAYTFSGTAEQMKSHKCATHLRLRKINVFHVG